MTHGGTPSVAWVSGGVARRWLEIFPAFDVEYRKRKFYPILKTSCNYMEWEWRELKLFTYISITFQLKYGHII